jgi:hypothetical protein
VEIDEDNIVEHHLKVEVPYAVAPVLPEEKGASPLRRFEISSRVTRTDGGSQIEVVSRSERTPVRLSYADRELGIEAVRKDRAVVRRLNESGLAFKIAP